MYIKISILPSLYPVRTLSCFFLSKAVRRTSFLFKEPAATVQDMGLPAEDTSVTEAPGTEVPAEDAPDTEASGTEVPVADASVTEVW